MKKAPNVTGIFAANDEMAVGIIVAALGNGKKVPQDLNVVGFDDSPFARAMWPTITSWRSRSMKWRIYRPKN